MVIKVYVSGQKTEHCIRLQNISVGGSVAALVLWLQVVCMLGWAGGKASQKQNYLRSAFESMCFLILSCVFRPPWVVSGMLLGREVRGGSSSRYTHQWQQIYPSVRASEWPWIAMALGFWPCIVGNLWPWADGVLGSEEAEERGKGWRRGGQFGSSFRVHGVGLMAWTKAMSASPLQAIYVILGASLLSAKEGFLWDVKQLQWGSIKRPT